MSSLLMQLRQHWQLLQLAIGFLTRLPMSSQLLYSPDRMHSALGYFPLVGWLLGLLLMPVYLLAEAGLGMAPAVCVLLITSLLLTGALHEDGLADCFDGFYGGLDQPHKLRILKDSRLGTYGSSALLLALLFKYLLLVALAEQGELLLALLIGYPLSRAMAITHAQDLPYVSAPGTSKSDPLAYPMNTALLMQVLVTGAAGLLWLPFWSAWVLAIAVVVMRWWLKRWMSKHLYGFTGDSLGAAQQLQELLIYSVLLALANGGQLA
ncbi:MULTISPECIES: adenosylcobinamide-GDP ribazoletransferase [unclassified Oceanobacter]|uniref:adenosylcobinamide-GDP ribazoletransferase n=1 Tax=unclassified Oceanobacter TaxID=2620260 RepID=UPI0027342FA1|nr:MULTISPECIES: adenosylcobinamide-GDP ribazoletransferase [unclassified Oceanobacter]MDP2608667.1 adenosylcobinamide-GDP ribazoletransferase [Oceanobacter sp. 1_MG-2023]MDP2611763.1 adenosylcobinamide-GDP ribazoletransferase [Oceanobacter sp. 2_MG-2023]